MNAPTDNRPTDTIRDAFEAMLWYLACLIGPLRPRKITPAEEIGALAACEVETDFEPNEPPAPLLALRDLIQRAAEEHNRRALLTPAEEAEIIASAPGQIGPGLTPIGHDADFTPERIREALARRDAIGEGLAAAAEHLAGEDDPVFADLCDAVNRANEAHAREDLPAALAEIERLQRERDGAREDADKISGQMVALHAAYDDQVSRIEVKLDAATAKIERLTAELAARAPADASLEARAEMVKEVLRASGVGLLVTHPSDGPSALQAVVRAVDASRPAAPEVDDDDEPLTRGAGVRTVAHLTALFSPSLHPHRRPNALGKIVRRMTSGDIYYDVRHDDGTEAGYERSELIDLTADTSRPGLTEEQARAMWRAMVAARPAHDEKTIDDRAVDLLLRASRGETGALPAARAKRRAQCEIDPDCALDPDHQGICDMRPPGHPAPTGLTRAMHDAAQRPSEPPDPLALDPEDGTLCADCKTPRNGYHGALCSVRAGAKPGRVPDPRATLRAGDPASPFAPGSLAAGSATEDRILDRKRGGK